MICVRAVCEMPILELYKVHKPIHEEMFGLALSGYQLEVFGIKVRQFERSDLLALHCGPFHNLNKPL